MSISTLKYPKKSHRKEINIPKECPELAEFMGIMAGDGGISNPWQIAISMNSVSDAQYAPYISGLIRKLFGLETTFLERERHTLRLICSSATLLDFLIAKGFPNGDKIRNGLDIPPWIGKSKNWERAFVRGLIDTDGCLYIHEHSVKSKAYHNIGLCFASFSKPLLKSVARIFNANQIKPHLTKNGTHLYLYKVESVVKYLRVFGSSNPRITRKYQEWKGVREA